MEFDYLQIVRLALPETILVIGALLVLFLDLVVLRKKEPAARNSMLASATAAICGMAVAVLQGLPFEGAILDGMLVMTPAAVLVKQAILVLTALTALISWRIEFSRHLGEYFALLLMATVGMLFLASSQHLLMLFVSLELTSLSLYVLVAFNKERRESAEAALKYFLFGGMAAAFTLFGLSLVYGLAGSLNLTTIAAGLRDVQPGPLFYVALVMTLTGFGFKIAVAPFHLWAPDAYQGAPTQSAAFIATGSKVASFYVLLQVLHVGFGGFAGDAGWGHFESGWQPVLAVFALFSMILGNLVALNQSSVKRLLAYSAIAHGGYLLVGVMANHAAGSASVVYYSITYALATLGAFAVISVVEREEGDDSMDSLVGLKERSPLLALSLMVFILSAAGIPPLAGFFGKFYVFTAAVKEGSPDLGLLWLVLVALVMSAVSFYYYLQVLKRALVLPAKPGARPWSVPPVLLVVIVIMAVGVLVFGCLPTLLIPEVTGNSTLIQ